MVNRLENLETKFSYQEHLIQELNDVIISQQKQIDVMENKLQQLSSFIQQNTGQQASNEPEAPPPHY
ncbi:MAG: SlyX family protein [Ghiorsea sp.]